VELGLRDGQGFRGYTRPDQRSRSDGGLHLARLQARQAQDQELRQSEISSNTLDITILVTTPLTAVFQAQLFCGVYCSASTGQSIVFQDTFDRRRALGL